MVILVTAIVIIVTRGKSFTIMRFLPRFVAIILFIFFSFAIIQFFYQFGDVIQGFFLRPPNSTASCPPKCISNENLLFVQWDYTKFEGLRKVGNVNSESAFITLLLTKLTALTYFVMVGLLFLRRIILWLFIIVSPIFPILLLFYPVRNTGKIWIGEFFRWLLYAPLFAIFLQGLVFLWQPSVTGRINNIPLVFENTADKGKEIYPTAVNILLGAPGEKVDLNNSVNIKETFAEYVVSLLMLWGVIILPWILLQIFLDYAQSIGTGDSAVMKNMMNIINRQGPPGVPAPYAPTSGGAAINLPFTKKFSMPNPPSGAGIAMEIPVSAASKYSTSYMPSAQVKAQTLTLTNMSLPSMRDIAKYDTSLISRDSSRQKEAITLRDNLVKIGNPASSSSTSDKERYTEIREKLTKESNSGNTLATSILTAANTASKRSNTATTSQIKSMLTQIANPQAAAAAGSSSVINREKLSKMNESLIQAKKDGNTLATAILGVTDKTPPIEIEKLQEKIRIAKEKGEPVATQIAAAMEKKDVLPVANRVQTVSKEDYQAVKDMWKENYKNLEVPEGMAGTRTEWVKDDISKIDNIISLMDSKDEEKISKGMEEVSSILPFLLVGGFSQAEIVSYLKAKQDAAKEVVASLDQDEEDKVSISVKRTATATSQMSASISDDSGDDDSNSSNISSVSKTIINPLAVSQATNEILKLTNLELPKLTDIVKYEVRSLTKDKTESERIEKMQTVLEKIGDPKNITTEAERAQYEMLREKLGQESLSGNVTASVILAAVSNIDGVVGQINVTLNELKTILTQIANPQNIEATEDRDYYTRLHEYLDNESKQTNNKLAQSILNVNDVTSTSDIQIIKEQLNSSSMGVSALPQVGVALNDFVKVKQLRTVISEILSPDKIVSKSGSQTYTNILKSVQEASKKGDALAALLLSVNPKTSDVSLNQIHKKLVDAEKKGDPIAKSVLAQVAEPGALSSANRLREITPEEYQEAKDLWEKAYKQYFVPEGFTQDTKGRLEWINKDIKDIEETIELLGSNDEDKKKTGIKKVSSILPFLLLGGFSFNEMIKYLQTKVEAARSALKFIEEEEDKSVEVSSNKQEEKPASMQANNDSEEESKNK